MNKKILVIAVAAAAAVIVFAYLASNQTGMVGKEAQPAPANSGPLVLVQTIELPNVSGRIDHMDIDLAGKRLFVSELENKSLDVLDLGSGKRIHSIGGLSEPQGVVFVPSAKRIFVANGGDGTVQVYNSDDYSLVDTIQLTSDADNMRYDVSSNLVYVGFGGGGIAVIDPLKGSLVGTVKLYGHPESFQVSRDPQPKIYVNVPESDSVQVVDLQKQQVVAKWPNVGAGGNYPMALDEASHRLFVVYREPAELHVIDTTGGNVTSKVPISGDPDGIFYDDKNGMLYISCGQGFVEVISAQGNEYREVAKVPTGTGARTSLFVPQLGRLYVAVPDYGSGTAKIDVFDTGTQ